MADILNVIYTIGHSTHSAENFAALLKRHKIDVVADVRSSPYSRMNPHFNQSELKRYIKNAGILYVFLGDQLGARSSDPSCYEQGKVQYSRLAHTNSFQMGIGRLLDGASRFRIAVMCAEKEPLECHRTILVARELVSKGVEVKHIHFDGSVESHDDAIDRLLVSLGMAAADIFRSNSDLIDKAYSDQSDKIAYVKKDFNAPVDFDGLQYEDPAR